MGLCRALVYCGAAAAATAAYRRRGASPRWPCSPMWRGSPMRRDRRASTRSAISGRSRAVGADAARTAGVGQGRRRSACLSGADRLRRLAIYLLAARPKPGAVSRAVGLLIAGISLVDAALLASAGAIAAAVAAMLAFPLDSLAAEIHPRHMNARPITPRDANASARRIRQRRSRCCAAGSRAVVAADASAWLMARSNVSAPASTSGELGIALGLARRKLGRGVILNYRRRNVAAARGPAPGWQPQFWATDEAARVALLLATITATMERFAARLDRLCVDGGNHRARRLPERVRDLSGRRHAHRPRARRRPLVDCAGVRGDRLPQSLPARPFRRGGVESDGRQMRVRRRTDRARSSACTSAAIQT